jgi:CRISPR-associated protein Csm3
MSDITFLGRAKLTAQIVLTSGLHIGAGKDTIEIGGIDNPVVKHPHTKDPYIPGSSIKGKLRFLLEWAFGKIRSDGKPWGSDEREGQTSHPDDPVLRLFGTPIKKEHWTGGPTRLIVRDAMLNDEWKNKTIKKFLPLTEDKTEVVIDRIAGKAHDKIGPRQTERVPAGAEFDLEIVFRAYDTGDQGGRDEACLNWFIAGLALLEQDALGGSGSRGYGRIKLRDLQFYDLAGKSSVLDNRFRIERFDPENPPSIVTLMGN